MSSKRQDSSYSKALTETSPSRTEDLTGWPHKPPYGIKGDKIYEFYHECVECRLEAGETPEDIISMRRVRYFGYDGDEAYIYASQALPVRLFNNDEPFCIPVSEIGKTVFLTKLEAEIRLKELRNMENKEAEAAMNKLKGKDNKDIERDIERD